MPKSLGVTSPATSAVLDKQHYIKGDPIIVTIVRAPGPIDVTVTIVGQPPIVLHADMPVPFTVTDPARTFATKSDDGTTAVSTSVA